MFAMMVILMAAGVGGRGCDRPSNLRFPSLQPHVLHVILTLLDLLKPARRCGQTRDRCGHLITLCRAVSINKNITHKSR